MSQSAVRRQLRYASEADVIADIVELRRLGYLKAGGWTLPQIAWHLNKTILARLRPGPFEPDSPEQVGRRDMLATVLATGVLPAGIVAPDSFVPPADAPASKIDELIDTLNMLSNYTGEIAPHRLFGAMNNAEARRLNLIHCAHHLSHLVPIEQVAPGAIA